MHHARKTRLSKLFRSFLFSYVLLLVIPLLTGIISYRVSLNSVKDSSVAASLAVLGQSKAILEQRFAEASGFTRQIAMEPNLNKLLTVEPANQGDNAYNLWVIWKNIRSYSLSNSFLQNFYVYLDNFDVIMTTESVYVRPDDYYDTYHYQDMNADTWRSEVLNGVHNVKILPAAPFVSSVNKGEEKASSVVTFIQSLPLENYQHSYGTIVILIDEKEIQNLLRPIAEEYGGWAYITDADDQVISTMDIDQSGVEKLDLSKTLFEKSPNYVFEKGNLLITMSNGATGWHYVVGIPEKIVLRKAIFIEKMTIAITSSTLIVGLLIALWLAYRNSAPINAVIRILREQNGPARDKGANDLDFLKGNISRLVESNNSLIEEAGRQLPLLRESIIRRVARGEFHSQDEILAYLLQAKISIGYDCGYMGIVHVAGYPDMFSKDILDELRTAKLVIKRELQALASGDIHIADLDADKLIVLYSFGREYDSLAAGQIEHMAIKVKQLIKEKYQISVHIAFGEPFARLAEASRSFEEAEQALEYGLLKNEDRVWWHRQIVIPNTAYFYPIGTEIRLMSALEAGDLAEVRQILRQIFKVNFEERSLSVEMIRQLAGELKGTLFKLLDQKLIQDEQAALLFPHEAEKVQLPESKEAIQQFLLDLFENCGQSFLQRKKLGTQKAFSAVVDYLEQSYGDSDINLHKIADATGLPEKYFTALFKKETGESVAEYLEKIRIQKAIELLFDSACTIDDIARRVGYNSAHAFRRAFKRVTGHTPGTYRHINANR